MTRRRGFTLVEMLIVSLLLSLVFAAAFALFGSVLRGQAREIAEAALDDQAAVIGQALLNACESGSYIEEPALPAGTVNMAYMRVWSNVSPADGASAIVPGVPVTFSHFCVDPGGSFFLYTGNYPYPAPPLACGAAPPAGTVRTRLTNGTMPATVTAQFTRYAADQVYITYTASLPATVNRQALSVSRTTLMQLQEGYQ